MLVDHNQGLTIEDDEHEPSKNAESHHEHGEDANLVKELVANQSKTLGKHLTEIETVATTVGMIAAGYETTGTFVVRALPTSHQPWYPAEVV